MRLTTCSTYSKIHRTGRAESEAMAGLVFWTAKRRKRLAALAAKGLTARAIAPRLAIPQHAPTAVAVRTVAQRFGIALLNPGGRPPKRKRGAAKRKGKRI